MDDNDWNVYLIALSSVVDLLLWQSVEVFEEQFNRPSLTVLKPRVKCYHGLWLKRCKCLDKFLLFGFRWTTSLSFRRVSSVIFPSIQNIN